MGAAAAAWGQAPQGQEGIAAAKAARPQAVARVQASWLLEQDRQTALWFLE
jgi:hypothetical protein